MGISLIKWAAGILPNAMSILATCAVCFFTILVYNNPDTRAALKRQSLIMLLAVLVVSVFFSLGSILGYVVPGDSPLCGISVNIMVFAGNFQHFVIMLIAVNLQLTVVHHISTAGYTFYYLAGSFVMSLITVLPGAVKHVWGYDPVMFTCWISTLDPKKRVSWTVGTTHAWTLLSAAVALCSTVVVLTKLTMSSRRVKKTFMDSGMNSSILSEQSILTSVTFRILPHPVFLVISNIITFTADFYASTKHRNSTIFNVVTMIFFTAPPLFFALVVLFFDPSLSTAIRQLFGKHPTILGITYTNPRISFNHTVELQTRPVAFPSSASLVQTESDVECGTQTGQSHKPKLYASDSVEGRLDFNTPCPANPAPEPVLKRHLGGILRTTGTISLLCTQPHATTTKSDNVDLTTL